MCVFSNLALPAKNATNQVTTTSVPGTMRLRRGGSSILIRQPLCQLDLLRRAGRTARDVRRASGEDRRCVQAGRGRWSSLHPARQRRGRCGRRCSPVAQTPAPPAGCCGDTARSTESLRRKPVESKGSRRKRRPAISRILPKLFSK